MDRRITGALAAIVTAAVILFSSCSAAPGPGPLNTARVQKGDFEVKVSADGSIEMPAAVNLYFDTTMFTPPYSARIRAVYVEKGQQVRAGTVLAKLDDTTQKMAVEASQYALELAINNVVQTVCCGVNRSPGFYCDAVALVRFEFAQAEIERALALLQSAGYEAASEQISLAKYDLEAARQFYSDPQYRSIRPDILDVTQAGYTDYDLDLAIGKLSAELDRLAALQGLIGAGDFPGAAGTMQEIISEMTETHSVVKRLNHLPQNTLYPDTCTAYTVVSEIRASLARLQALPQQVDPVKYAETLSIIRHDMELADKVLDENISTFRAGLNLKALRDYNIAVQTAIINLQRSKQALLRSELIAPFDGRVTDVNLRAGDMISQRYTATGAPIDSYVIQLANTSAVRWSGVIDEIDIARISGRPQDTLNAVVLVDAFPGQKFSGRVTFISPFGPTQASGIQYYGTLQTTLPTYRVEIALDPAQTAYLAGGQTAVAEILTETRSGVLMVPNAALSGGSGGYSVRVLKDGKTGLTEQRVVATGMRNRDFTEIKAGLAEGETVVLEKAAAAGALRR